MRAIKVLKVKWQNIVIVLLLLSLMAGIALPAMADVIKIRPLAISRSVTLVVAANDAPALSKAQADYVCDGTDDHVQIQAATDALPATGGKVLLTQGTFNTESSITLDSYQTFQGMGRSTILTTSTNDLTFLSATGSSGSEKIGIAIADMQIDGTASKISNCGIYFEYVDYSTIRGIYTRRHAYTLGSQRAGIYLIYSDLNSIIDNLCEENDYAGGGIVLVYAENNVINNNILADNNFGIDLAYEASHNVVVGNNCYGGIDGIVATYSSIANVIDANVCRSNTNGIYIEDSSYNLITNNLCYGNDEEGIYMDTADHCTISGNILTANSQGTNNTYDNLYLTASDRNNIQGNTCRAGALANVPRYGINIADVACDGNLVINNDLYDDGFGTAPYNDSGTGTIYVEPGIDDTPVDGETGQPISSNWAFDHNAAATGVHGVGASTVDSVAARDAAIAAIEADYPQKLKPEVTRWVIPGWHAEARTFRTIIAGYIFYIPIFVTETTTYIRIACEVTTAAAGTADLRIFAWNDGLPGALILSAGTVNTGTTGVKQITISQELTRGYYFLAIRCSGAPIMYGPSYADGLTPPVAGIATSPGSAPTTVPYVIAAYADPAPAPTGMAASEFAVISLREN